MSSNTTNIPSFPIQRTSCVFRATFLEEMEKCFGTPIGSNTNSKVLSDERCAACLNYLANIETNDIWRQRTIEGQHALTSAGYNLDELHQANSPWAQPDIPQGAVNDDLQAYPSHIHPQLIYYLKCRRRAAAAALNTEFPTTDPASTSAGDSLQEDTTNKVPVSTPKQIKSTISRAGIQRFFVEAIPHPISSKPLYRLIHSVHKSQSKTVVATPSTWFDILTLAHENLDHAGRDKLTEYIRPVYWNIPKVALEKFTVLCAKRQQSETDASDTQTSVVPGLKLEDEFVGQPEQQQEETSQVQNCTYILDSQITSRQRFLSRQQIFIIANEFQECPFKGVLCFLDVACNFIHIYPVEVFSAESIAFIVLEFMQTFGGIHILHCIRNFEDAFIVDLLTHVNKHWHYPIIMGETNYNEMFIDTLIERIETNLRTFAHDPDTVPVGDSAHQRWRWAFGYIAYCMNSELKQNGKSSFEEAFRRVPNMSSLYPCLSHGQVAKIFGNSVVRESDIVGYIGDGFSVGGSA